MRFERLLELVNAVAQSGLTDFRYEEGDTRIAMSRAGREQMPEETWQSAGAGEDMLRPCAAQGKAEAAQEGGGIPQRAPADRQTAVSEDRLIASPLVGTFYTAPSEDAETYVRVGDFVKKGQTLAIVEAMKLMNEIECEYDGTVEEILVKNGQGVEYGQPLFRIR